MADFVGTHVYELILVILVLTALVSTQVSISRKGSAIDRSVARAIEESKEQIQTSISPRVVFCASIDQVRSEAAEIILAAANEFDAAVVKNAEFRARGTGKEEDISQYFVTIYGAASLAYQEGADTGSDNAVQQKYLTKYNQARQRASQCKLRFRRYVSLLEPAELPGRSEAVQKQYIAWLNDQKRDLARDANYAMIISPRAPRWGSSNTSIIGNEGIVEIKGHGGSAFAIYSERIASDLRASLRADIDGSLPTNRDEISFANKGSMRKLTKLIKECEEAISRAS